MHKSVEFYILIKAKLWFVLSQVKISRSGLNERHYAGNIVKWIFLTENMLYSDWNATEICSLGSNWQYVNLVSNSDLILNKHLTAYT